MQIDEETVDHRLLTTVISWNRFKGWLEDKARAELGLGLNEGVFSFKMPRKGWVMGGIECTIEINRKTFVRTSDETAEQFLERRRLEEEQRVKKP